MDLNCAGNRILGLKCNGLGSKEGGFGSRENEEAKNVYMDGADAGKDAWESDNTSRESSWQGTGNSDELAEGSAAHRWVILASSILLCFPSKYGLYVYLL